MRRFFTAFLAALMCAAFCGCAAQHSGSGGEPDDIIVPTPAVSAALQSTAATAPVATEAGTSLTPAPTPAETPAWQVKGQRSLSAWAVYWDTADVVSEIASYADRLKELCYFEVFFAPDGSFIMPDDLKMLYSSVEGAYPDNRWDSYVTFVNDLRYENGSFDLKSTDIIAPFLKNAETIDAHTEALVGFALDNGFDGVEIDYEALKKAPELWEPFVSFIGRLYEKTKAAGLLLRVVLEPYAPFAEYAFPKGPTYVIMCYNLHGSHNDEGPKADYDFLSMLLQSASALPGKRIYALATGGYDWDENGDATQVSLREAYRLFSSFGTDATIRDASSEVLSFHYTDEDGHAHTVWFADTRTLAAWSEYMTTSGFGELAYWRLGGNYLE